MSDQEEQQQWILVKPSKKKHIRKEINPNRIHSKGVTPLKTVLEQDAEQNLLASKSANDNKNILKGLFASAPQQMTVHCLGLGHFQSILKPFLQMLFLKRIIIPELQEHKINFQVNVYDPIFSEEEIDFIAKENWSCRPYQQIKGSKNCLFFMPHCERELYELILKDKKQQQWWLVIGNSIRQYKERCKMLGQTNPKIFDQFNPSEQSMKDYRQAFNDTVVYIL